MGSIFGDEQEGAPHYLYCSQRLLYLYSHPGPQAELLEISWSN